MAKARADLVLHSLLSQTILSNLTDRDLIERFVRGEKTAFPELVTRHTPMILGVCQRILPSVQDAEDACQAVFLILVAKVRTARWNHSIANWLYTTARQVSFRARRAIARRVLHEASAVPIESATSPLDQMTAREAFLVLDEELGRLTKKYREPLVLCCLEGLTREEAAARLGWKVGSLKARLERGRRQLSAALARRGMALGSSLLAVTASSASATRSPDLRDSILTAVLGSPSSAASILAKEFIMAGFVTKAKTICVLALAVVGIGLGVVAGASTADPVRSGANDTAMGSNSIGTDEPKSTEKTNPIYSLKEGEVLKLIRPTADSRDQVYQELMKGSDIPHERMLMVIQSDKGQLKVQVAGSRKRHGEQEGKLVNGWPLGELIENTFKVSAAEIIAEESVLKTIVDADVLLKSKANRKDLLAALAKELKAGSWGEYRILDIDLELPCFVATGEYKLDGMATVDLFADDRQPEPTASHFTTTDNLIKALSSFIGVRIINESNLKKQDKNVTIHEHIRHPATPDKRAVDCDSDKVLKNVSKQTGLTFKLAKRKQRFIFIEDMIGTEKK